MERLRLPQPGPAGSFPAFQPAAGGVNHTSADCRAVFLQLQEGGRVSPITLVQATFSNQTCEKSQFFELLS